MKRKFIIILGMASPFLLLILCITALLLTGIGGWLLLGSEDKSRIIQIAPVAPMIAATPGTEPTAIAAVITASPTPDLGMTATTVAEPKSQATAIPTVPTPDVEEILGFPLPAGSINSVTQEGVATRLVIPRLNLDAPVVVSPIKDQTWQVDHLGQAIGHLEGTAAPGSSSNIVLAGHITLAEGVYGPFAGLGQLSPGDLLVVYHGEQKFNYVIDGYDVVDRTAIEVTYPSKTGQVTLITCNNWNSELNQYEQRLVVKGHLIDS